MLQQNVIVIITWLPVIFILLKTYFPHFEKYFKLYNVTLKIFYYFYLCTCVCAHMYVCPVYEWPWRPEESYQVTWSWGYKSL